MRRVCGSGWYHSRMKKPLLFFILAVLVLIVIAFVHQKYCESKPSGCKKRDKSVEEIGGPYEGIDW